LGVDPISNLFIRRAGRDEAAAVVTGSHLDTQPTGGKFDGSYGVLAGLEAIEAMSDLGLATRRLIDLVVWTNEEGYRFQPTTMGSAVFACALQLEDALRRPTPPAFPSAMPWPGHLSAAPALVPCGNA
jgi:N-carbamoyl-L-amino-acid hydrolase